MYGLTVDVPITTPFFRKSTFEIVPSVSEAFALSVIVAKEVYVDPLRGEVNETIGFWFDKLTVAPAAYCIPPRI